MKAKRRHELKTNELAQSIQDMRFYLQRRGGLVLGVSVAAILVLIVGAVWRRSAAQARSDGWQSYYNIRSGQQGGTERLSNALTLSDNTADPTLARLALQLAAQVAWAEAHPTGEPFDADKLKQSEQAYERLLTTYPDSVHTVGTAHRGLAAIAEEWADQATSASDRERYKAQARKHYQAIINDDRLADLPARMVADAQIVQLDERLVPMTFGDLPTLLARPTTAPVVTPAAPGLATPPAVTPTTVPGTATSAPTTAPVTPQEPE